MYIYMPTVLINQYVLLLLSKCCMLFCVTTMATANLTGYGPRRTLIFDGDESKYELWEVKFLGYMRLQKLYDVVVKKTDEAEAPTAEKNATAFAELIQCLDDRSLALVIRRPKTTEGERWRS